MIGIQSKFVIKSFSWGILIGTFFSKRYFVSAASLQMQRIRNDGLGGRGVTFIPSSGSYKNVVVWMHGLGDTADGWASMMPSLGLTETKFILPTADNKPISINGGMPMPAWSDIYGLDDKTREDRVGFDQSKSRIDRIVQAEIDKGIEPKRVVIAGFSQGGALAFHTALRSVHPLGGCIGLSTWVPLHSDYPAAISPAAAANLKILQVLMPDIILNDRVILTC